MFWFWIELMHLFAERLVFVINPLNINKLQMSVSHKRWHHSIQQLIYIKKIIVSQISNITGFLLNGKISGQFNRINLLKIFVFIERKSNGNEWRWENWTYTTNFLSILSIFVQVVLLFPSIETLTDPSWMPYSVEEKTTIAQQPHHQLKWTCTRAATDNRGYRSKRNKI